MGASSINLQTEWYGELNDPLVRLTRYIPGQVFVDLVDGQSPSKLVVGIVRHGDTGTIGRGMFSGTDPYNPQTYLTEEGYRKAEILGWNCRLVGFNLAAVMTADLPRARETALGIIQGHRIKGVPIIKDSYFPHERDFGVYEGLKRDTLTHEELAALNLLHDTEFHKKTGVETMASFYLRGILSLWSIHQVIKMEQNNLRFPRVILVTHGAMANVIAGVYRSAFKNLDLKDRIIGYSDDFKQDQALPSGYIRYQEGLENPVILNKFNPCEGMFFTEEDFLLYRYSRQFIYLQSNERRLQLLELMRRLGERRFKEKLQLDPIFAAVYAIAFENEMIS